MHADETPLTELLAMAGYHHQRHPHNPTGYEHQIICRDTGAIIGTMDAFKAWRFLEMDGMRFA